MLQRGTRRLEGTSMKWGLRAARHDAVKSKKDVPRLPAYSLGFRA